MVSPVAFLQQNLVDTVTPGTLLPGILSQGVPRGLRASRALCVDP